MGNSKCTQMKDHQKERMYVTSLLKKKNISNCGDGNSVLFDLSKSL